MEIVIMSSNHRWWLLTKDSCTQPCNLTRAFSTFKMAACRNPGQDCTLRIFGVFCFVIPDEGLSSTLKSTLECKKYPLKMTISFFHQVFQSTHSMGISLYAPLTWFLCLMSVRIVGSACKLILKTR